MAKQPAIRDRVKELRRVKASDLVAHESNWRTHPEGQVAAMQGVLKEIGFAGAILVRELPDGKYGILDGHCRKELSGDDEVPVLVLDLNEDEAKVLLATYDPIGAMAEADTGSLDTLLKGLAVEDEAVGRMLDGLAAEHGIDLDEGGLSIPEEAPEPQIDRAAELQKEWGTETGQLWTIQGKAGVHRVLCGDCREPADMARLCVEKVNGCFTSPPYAEQRKAQYGGTPADEYVEWWEAVQSGVRGVLAEDGSFFVNIKPHCEGLDRSLYVLDVVVAMKRKWDWHFAEEFCWERSGIPQQVVRRFKNQFEPVYQFTLGEWKIRPEDVRHECEHVPIPMGRGKAGDTNAAKRQGRMSAVGTNEVAPGMAYPGNRIRTSQDTIKGHPAAFSTGLPSFFMQAFSDEGDTWLDPFLGSGTTLIAAEQLSRVCYGIEISPGYVAVILQRCKDAGLTPELSEQGTAHGPT